ncbi:uncharacterized protein PRCAT00004255001 [Priceomyces carsonii]|uniref:uncharacterized protein n=1 Tax=Priceomyces carsonii TaxID=28549 RepID=UPI002EDB138E|nr:unnamed protein product [Priceomyces carsonii]
MYDIRSFYEDEHISAWLSETPTTTGETEVILKNKLCLLNEREFCNVLLSTKRVADIIKNAIKVKRVALVTTSNEIIKLVPLHGLSNEWKSLVNTKEEFNEKFPGYISSRNGPRSTNKTLDQMRDQLTQGCHPSMDYTFIGNKGKDSLFGKIVRGEYEQWRIWEDKCHVAFLTPFGNAPGFTVVVPRCWKPSDIFSLQDNDYVALSAAVFLVSNEIKHSLNIRRVGIIFEGMEVDYAHAKLIPILEDDNNKIEPEEQDFSNTYDGTVSSKVGPRVALKSLQDTREAIDVSLRDRKSS